MHGSKSEHRDNSLEDRRNNTEAVQAQAPTEVMAGAAAVKPERTAVAVLAVAEPERTTGCSA